MDSQWFDSVILLCIVVSCVTLAAQDPTKPSDTGVNQWLNYIDQAVLWVYIFEAATKVRSAPHLRVCRSFFLPSASVPYGPTHGSSVRRR